MPKRKSTLQEAQDFLNTQADGSSTILLRVGDGGRTFLECNPKFVRLLAAELGKLQVRVALGDTLTPLEQLGYYALANHLKLHGIVF